MSNHSRIVLPNYIINHKPSKEFLNVKLDSPINIKSLYHYPFPYFFDFAPEEQLYTTSGLFNSYKVSFLISCPSISILIQAKEIKKVFYEKQKKSKLWKRGSRIHRILSFSSSRYI